MRRRTSHDSQKKIHTPENITKIPTTIRISPYLQVFKVSNKLLTPLPILNIYMSSYPYDINLIPDIITQITILTKHHPTHKTILVGDFNRSILLQGHTQDGTPQAPTHKDRKWACCMQTLTLRPIQNTKILSRQGGHNYSSTSLIDGFYTNTSNHTNLTCTTLLHQNQNSNHYPISLDLGLNTLVQKVNNPTRHTPKIT